MSFEAILATVRGVAERFMLDEVEIRNRLVADFDDENPSGDDTPEWETTTTTVPGWLVDPATKSMQDDGGMSVVVSDPTLRLPVGTVISRGAIVTVHGKEFRVVGDPSDDETWPAMLKVRIARSE